MHFIVSYDREQVTSFERPFPCPRIPPTQTTLKTLIFKIIALKMKKVRKRSRFPALNLMPSRN
jgi:hypothetical protein